MPSLGVLLNCGRRQIQSSLENAAISRPHPQNRDQWECSELADRVFWELLKSKSLSLPGGGGGRCQPENRTMRVRNSHFKAHTHLHPPGVRGSMLCCYIKVTGGAPAWLPTGIKPTGEAHLHHCKSCSVNAASESSS